MTDRSPPRYARPLAEIVPGHVGALLDAFAAATGLHRTFAAKLAGLDPKLAKDYRTQNFTCRVYDRFVARMSAIWPDGAAWPADVPRQAPAEIEPEMRAAYDARLARARPDGAGAPADHAPPDKEGV